MLYVTKDYGMMHDSAVIRTQRMVRDICVNGFGAREIPIFLYDGNGEDPHCRDARFDGMAAGVVPNTATVLVQYPTWHAIEWERALVERLKVGSGCKTIIFVEDVLPLVYPENRYLLPKTVSYLNLADTVILPSVEMHDFLRAHGLTVPHVVIQGMWDCPALIYGDNLTHTMPPYKQLITFAGSVNTPKFNFLDQLDTSEVSFQAYCTNDQGIDKPNVIFHDPVEEDELIRHLRRDGGWGLVWSEDDNWREYMKLNCSAKLANYIAAGLPVVLPADAAQARIVTANQIGITAHSLDEAVNRVKAVTPEQYRTLCNNVQRIAELVRNGVYTRRAIASAITDCYDWGADQLYTAEAIKEGKDNA